MTVSTPQIVAQLDAVLAKDQHARAIAIGAPTAQSWPERLQHRGQQFVLRWCDSMLSMRAALSELDESAAGDPGLVLLTPLQEHQVAQDILSRLARNRIFQPQGWEVVRQLFSAKQIDARLGRYAWMPQVLIDATATGNYDPVPNGFLDLETAWREVLVRCLGMDAARPDAVSILAWSLDPSSAGALNLLPEAARTAVLAWLVDSCGPTARLIQGCIAGNRLSDALPIALACEVVFGHPDQPVADLGNAAIRLERYVNDMHVGFTEGKAWADQARQLIIGTGPAKYRLALDRADDLVRELRVGEFAYLSDDLPCGLDQRLRQFAEALTTFAQAPSAAQLVVLEAHVDRVLGHRLLPAQPQRFDRVVMARRLSRWMLRPDAPTTTLKDAAAWQTGEGAYVDWARFRLLGGDELPEVSSAYTLLRDAVIQRRDEFARRFADLLDTWNAGVPEANGRLVPVEGVLAKLVAPLAAKHPVLVLVVDGLSASIYQELFANVASQGWVEVLPEADLSARVGIAALPTVTEVSRTSLLCGRLAIGGSNTEKSGFAAHPELLKVSHPGSPPRLFHKGELAETGNLSSELRAAIADKQRQVIGVVYNAVDDHLSGPEQLHQRWNLEDLRLLLPLLHEARHAGRLVIVTADHGHLLEDSTRQVTGGVESDRWTQGERVRHDGERLFRGGRVVTAEGPRSILCLWGERTRYGLRKNGYHGGVAPQEVTVPLHVLAPLGLTVANWVAAPPDQPDWWELPHFADAPRQIEQSATTSTRRHGAKRQAPQETRQSALFETIEAPVAPVAPAQDGWVVALLASPIYGSQRQLAARVAPKDEQMRALLLALHERGGKLTKPALAQRLGLAELRLSGLLSAVRRLLNVDQAQVVSVDEVAGTVTLNHGLLMQQFGLNGSGVHT